MFVIVAVLTGLLLGYRAGAPALVAGGIAVLIAAVILGLTTDPTSAALQVLISLLAYNASWALSALALALPHLLRRP